MRTVDRIVIRAVGDKGVLNQERDETEGGFRARAAGDG